MAKPADTQRSKVYAAERSVFEAGSTPLPQDVVGKARTKMTQDEAQRLATVAVAWLRSKGYRAPDPRVEMKRGYGAFAAWTGGRIRLGYSAPYRWIMLHEIAHLVTAVPGWDGEPDERAHGAEFCAVYLVLVRHYLGVAAHDALRDAFKTQKARYRPKRTRPISDERRAELAARLAANRRTNPPARYAFVLRPDTYADLGPITHAALPHPRGGMRHLPVDDAAATIYASSRVNDGVKFRSADGWNRERHGTVNPDRALTRASVESLERWGAENCHWHFVRSDYDIVDLALTPALADVC